LASHPDSPDFDRLKTFYTESITRHLKELYGWAANRMPQGVTARGHVGTRRSHELVLSPMELTGSRLVDIARQSGVSKNAIGQLADELEALNYVCRQYDPSDGHAKRLQYTAAGIQLLTYAMATGEEMEEELAALIGKRKADLLKALISELVLKIRDQDIG